MPTISAGILLYRLYGGSLEVLLVHPGGPYWSGKDIGAWSIPKGLIDGGEDPFVAARREFEEETGWKPSGPCIHLNPVKQKGGKVVHAWACEGDWDPVSIKSNTFTMEWPPRSGTMMAFPEVDTAAWFGIEEAKNKINRGQVNFLDELEQLVKQKSETPNNKQ